LALESIYDVERSDSLALGMLGVSDSVTDDALQEGFEDTAGLLIDHCIFVRTWCGGNASELNILAEIRLTPPRRARRRMAGLVIP